MRLARSASLLGFVVLVACGATETVASAPASSDAGPSAVAPPSPPEGDAGGPATPRDASAEDGAPADAAAKAGVVLYAAGAAGIAVYRDAEALVASRAPDGFVPGAASAVAVSGKRVFVAQAGHVDRYDDGPALDAGAGPSGGVSRGDVRAIVAAGGDLLLTVEAAGIQVFPFASRLNEFSVPVATLVHPFQQIMFAAYEPSSDRVYGGQVSGAGLLGWARLSARTGRVESDLRVGPGAYWAGAVDRGDLYVAGARAAGEAGISMWRGAATLVPEAPAVQTSTGYRAGFLSAVAAKNGVLAVAALAQNAVFIYRDASALTAGAAADHVISRPELEQPTSLVFDRTGRLYVGDSDGVLVFDSAASGPAFVTELRGAGRVSALAVLE